MMVAVVSDNRVKEHVESRTFLTTGEKHFLVSFPHFSHGLVLGPTAETLM